jgi:hypothetical protein
MSIAKSDTGKTPEMFLPAQLENEVDLLAQLLGELSRPFDILSKRDYDFAVLDDGIDKNISAFEKAIAECLARTTPKGDVMEFARLNRPVIVQARSLDSFNPEVVQMLFGLQGFLKSRGRTFVVFPAHDSLEKLGGALARDLRSALKLTGIVPSLTVDTEITDVFCRATRDLFEVQLKTPLRFVGAGVRIPGEIRKDCHTGIIDLEGGSVVVSAMVTLPEKVIPELMKRMTGLTQIPVELLRNGPAEFANIIGGAARGRLNAAGYALRSPTIPKTITPDQQHLLAAADSSVAIEVRFETVLGQGFLELRFFS